MTLEQNNKSGTDANSKLTEVGPPLWLLAELTYECPLHCPYCSNPMNMEGKDLEINTQKWLEVLSQARDMGAVQLGFSGGEPLLRKDLEILVKHAKDLGFYSNLITSFDGTDMGWIDYYPGSSNGWSYLGGCHLHSADGW